MISCASFVSALPESEVVTCDVGGEVALLQLRRGAYYGLDPIGARIWHLLSQPQRVAQVRDILTREFHVEAPECERDLIALLQQMAEAELVKVQSEVA